MFTHPFLYYVDSIRHKFWVDFIAHFVQDPDGPTEKNISQEDPESLDESYLSHKVYYLGFLLGKLESSALSFK